MTLKVIHCLQTFSHAIRRTFCVAFYTISTDSVLAWFLCISRVSCSSPVAVRPLIFTKLCMRIEDVRPIFAPPNFFGSDQWFVSQGQWPRKILVKIALLRFSAYNSPT